MIFLIIGVTPAFALNQADFNAVNSENKFMSSLSRSVNSMPSLTTSPQSSITTVENTQGVVLKNNEVSNPKVITNKASSAPVHSENKYLSTLRGDAAALHPQLVELVNNYTALIGENEKNKVLLQEKYQADVDKSIILQGEIDNFVLNLDNGDKLYQLKLEYNNTQDEMISLKNQLVKIDDLNKKLEDKKQGYLKILSSVDDLTSVDEAHASAVIDSYNSNMNSYGKSDITMAKLFNQDNETGYDVKGDYFAQKLVNTLMVNITSLNVGHCAFQYLKPGDVVQLWDPSNNGLNCYVYCIYQGKLSNDDGSIYVLCTNAAGSQTQYLLGEFVNLFTGVIIDYDNGTIDSVSVLKAVEDELNSEYPQKPGEQIPNISDPSYTQGASSFSMLMLEMIQGGAWALSLISALTANIISMTITGFVASDASITVLSALQVFITQTAAAGELGVNLVNNVLNGLATTATLESFTEIASLITPYIVPGGFMGMCESFLNGGGADAYILDSAATVLLSVVTEAMSASLIVNAISIVTLEFTIAFTVVTTSILIVSTVISIIAAYNRDHFYRQDPVVPAVSYFSIFGGQEVSYHHI